MILMNDPDARPYKILFVCLANLCRSPLAEVIARSLYPGEIDPASAGISPGGAPFEEAVDVIKRFYGVDVSRHRPRHVLDFPVGEFDFIIAMDSSIFMKLASMKEIPRDKLYGWEIDDPVDQGIYAYEATARKLEREIEKFLQERDIEKRSFRARPRKDTP